jgi:hypothetical protein
MGRPFVTLANNGSAGQIIRLPLEPQTRILNATIHKYQQPALNQTGTATRHQKARRVIATSGDDIRYNRTRPLPPGYKAIDSLGEIA